MTVYMVQNNDGIIISICLRKRKAQSIVEKIGHARWHEDWTVVPLIIDEVDPAMLAGSDSYRRLMRKISDRVMKTLESP